MYFQIILSSICDALQEANKPSSVSNELIGGGGSNEILFAFSLFTGLNRR